MSDTEAINRLADAVVELTDAIQRLEAVTHSPPLTTSIAALTGERFQSYSRASGPCLSRLGPLRCLKAPGHDGGHESVDAMGGKHVWTGGMAGAHRA